jgi:polyisoprenoid-binding protein YceI
MKKVFFALILLASTHTFAQQDFSLETKDAWVIFEFVSKDTKGTLSNVEAIVRIDPSDLTNSKVIGTVDVSTIDTGNEGRDNHLKADDIFDAEKYPKMSFESGSVTLEGDTYLASGSLTIRDITKEVTFIITLEDKVLVFSTTINADDYGVGVKDEHEENIVKVKVHVPLL